MAGFRRKCKAFRRELLQPLGNMSEGELDRMFEVNVKCSDVRHSDVLKKIVLPIPRNRKIVRRSSAFQRSTKCVLSAKVRSIWKPWCDNTKHEAHDRCDRGCESLVLNSSPFRPKGFAFAWFKIENGDIGVYSVRLKSNLITHGNREGRDGVASDRRSDEPIGSLACDTQFPFCLEFAEAGTSTNGSSCKAVKNRSRARFAASPA